MSKRNKNKNAVEVVAAEMVVNAVPESFSLVDANVNEINETVPEVSSNETPVAVAEAEPKGKKAKSVKGQVAIRDNGFRVLQTVSLDPTKVMVSDFTGRAAPVSEDRVIELAESIRKNGQMQAIQVRMNAADPECVFGHTRLAAGVLLVNGYTVDGKEILPNPNFKIRAEVVDADAQSAALAKIIENEFRTETTAIDKAKNHQRMRDEFGMSDVSIAKQCNYASSASVSRLKKLLELDEQFQGYVANGTLTANGGYLLAGVPAEERGAVWLAAVTIAEGEDSVGESTIKKAIKKVKEEKASANAPTVTDGTNGTVAGTATEPGTATATEGGTTTETSGTATASVTAKTHVKTVKEFKDSLAELASDPNTPANVAVAMQVITGYINGETSDRDFAQWFAANVK